MPTPMPSPLLPDPKEPDAHHVPDDEHASWIGMECATPYLVVWSNVAPSTWSDAVRT